jgi:hypothetical protein
MPDCIVLFRYQISSGIISLSQSGTELTGCRTVRHSGSQHCSSQHCCSQHCSSQHCGCQLVIIAVVSIAVVSIAVVSIAVVSIGVVSIAAVSIAEPNHVISNCHAAPVQHVMRLQSAFQ